MDLFLAICAAIGLGLAAGIGGPLAWLFTAVMAGFEAGIDPRGTDWAFVGSGWFIATMFAANVAAFYGRRRGGAPPRLPYALGTAVVAGVFGAAALAAEDESAVFGFLLAALSGGLASLLATDVLAGAQRRAAASARGEGEAAETLPLIFGLAGIVTAALALFAPPASLLALVALAVLAAGRRRRAGEKYEGLRVLR